MTKSNQLTIFFFVDEDDNENLQLYFIPMILATARLGWSWSTKFGSVVVAVVGSYLLLST